MDEPITSSTPAASGNVAIPEWMLKRRARQAEASTDHPTEPIATSPSRAGASSSIAATADSPQLPINTSVRPLAPHPVSGFAASVHSAPSIQISSPAKLPAARIAFVPPQVQPDQPQSWIAAVQKHWLPKAAWRSFLISLGAHFAAALSLSMVVFHSELTHLGLSTLLAVQSEEASADLLDESSVFQLDTSGGQTSEALDTILSAKSVPSVFDSASFSVPENIGGIGASGEGNGSGDGIGDGLNVGGYKMPEGGKAIQKGSFTAWTVPEDPEPGEDYKIVIQVKYKRSNQKVPAGDITGSIIGTDKYRLMISPHTSEIIADANQVVIYIPGAAARVRDTIRVYSAMLKENQRLEIVF